jgi:hypothetical protein
MAKIRRESNRESNHGVSENLGRCVRLQRQWKIRDGNKTRFIPACQKNNNTFTWSGPNGAFGSTGQRRYAPAVGGLHETQVLDCAIEPADSVDYKKIPRGKRLRPKYREGDKLSHAYSFALNRQPLVCLQLRTLRIRDRSDKMFIRRHLIRIDLEPTFV